MKKQNCRKTIIALLFAALLVLLCGTACLAEGLSDDNSLYSLGITTEGATVSPEFYYSTIEYEVTVPAGTTSLSLDPVTSNEYATILDISGTELTDGQTTVKITVSSQSGSECTYYLYVTADGDSAGTTQEVTEAQTEPATEKQTETETEPETEDPRYVSVARDTLEEANNTITALKEETSGYRDRLDEMTKIMYALIAVCVVLLFVVINLLLKKRDLRLELKSYRSYGYASGRGQEADERSGSSENPRRGKKAKKKNRDYQETVQGQDAGADLFSARQEQQASAAQPAPAVQTQEGRRSSSVPKPSRENVKSRKKPSYDPPAAPYQYEPPKDDGNKRKDVEVTMIDL